MDSKASKNKPDFEIVDWAVGYIMSLKNHQLRKMTVNRLAHELNISRAYLYYLCKTNEKMSPGEFLRYEKLCRAGKMLMKRPWLSVKKISKKLGFNTVDYFIRVFKDRFGITPLKFRKYCQINGPGGVDYSTGENKCLNQDL